MTSFHLNVVKIPACQGCPETVDLRVHGFLEVDKVEIFGEPVVDQTPEPGFESRIFGQDESAVGRVDDLVGVHARAGKVANGPK